MKNYIILVLTFFITNVMIGQITFSACPDSFTSDPNVYNFVLEGTDATGRNYYQTNDIDGAQSCEAGVCEFRIAWSNTNNRWEVLLLQSDLDFSDATVVYYNSSASTPNPPSLSLGAWEDSASVCGGALTESNSTFTGAVQNTTLAIEDKNLLKNLIQVYPNPANVEVFISSKNVVIKNVMLHTILGEEIISKNNSTPINISKLARGVYVIKIETELNGTLKQKIIVN